MNELILDFRNKSDNEYQIMISKLIDFLKNKSGDGILAVASDAHAIWTEIEKSGIHIGMRNARWNIVKDIPVITINGVKLVFATDEDDPRMELFKSGEYKVNSIPVLENLDIFDLRDKGVSIGLSKLEGKLMGWDYETRSMPLFPDFKPLGFSLVSDDYGMYIDFRHYTDYDSDDFKELKEFIIRNQRNLITYNLRFETHCFLHMFDTWIYPLDAMVVMACEDLHINLKAAAQRFLGVPSWDDELDYEQKLCDEYSLCRDVNPERAQEIKDQIIKRRLEIDPEADVSLYSSMDEGIGNAWEMCYPPALAKYCILDSYYTLKLYEKVAPNYSQLCLNIFHKNFYQESYLSATPMPIKVKEAEELFKNSMTINRNANLMLNRIYGELLERRYGNVDYSTVFTPVEIALIEMDKTDLLSSPPEKILKELVCSALETKDAKLLAKIYGKQNAITILSSGVTLEDKRKKKVWTELAAKIGLRAEAISPAQRFNEKINKGYLEVISKYNALAEQLCPLKSKDMTKLVKYRRILQMTDEQLGYLGNPKLIEFFKSIPEKHRSLFLDWVSPKNMEYILNCPNPKFPTLKAQTKFNKLEDIADYKNRLESLILAECSKGDFEDDLLGFSKGNFIRYKDWIPFQYICDLISYRASKKYYDILDEINLYDPRLVDPNEIKVPNPDKGGSEYMIHYNFKDKMCNELLKDYSAYKTARENIKLLLSVTSEQESFKLLDLLEAEFPDIMGRYTYLSDQLVRYENKSTWEDFLNLDGDKLDVRSMIYPLDTSIGETGAQESVSIRHVVTDRWVLGVSICNNWTNLMENGYLKKGYDKLTVPNESDRRFFYSTVEYLWIKFGTDKELSPYLFGNNGFNTKRYKVTKRTNNYSIIDHNEKGDAFLVRFNVAEKSTF